MSLPRPLRRLVAAAPPDDAVDRMWHAIDARRPSRRRPRVLALGVAFAAAAAVFLVLRPAPEPAPAPAPVLSLLLSDGQPLPAQLAPSTHLSDGSTIALTAAHLDVLETDASHATFLLRDGRAHFDVVPNGPRRWVIECGLAVVEVVGTSFTIDRTPTTVTVTVDHGVVLVRSPHLPDGIRRLTATQSLSVSTPEPEPEPEPVLSPTPPSALPPASLPGSSRASPAFENATATGSSAIPSATRSSKAARGASPSRSTTPR